VRNHDDTPVQSKMLKSSITRQYKNILNQLFRHAITNVMTVRSQGGGLGWCTFESSSILQKQTSTIKKHVYRERNCIF